MIELGEVGRLAEQLKDAAANVVALEDQLKSAKEVKRKLEEEDLPGAMMELGLSEVKLESGEKITIKDVVYASIPKRCQQEAFAWLQEHGFGGLIKSSVQVNFNREELEEAKILFDQLSSNYHAQFNENVHTMTLKAWLKEQLQEGRNVPLDLFGARPVTTAVIK